MVRVRMMTKGESRCSVGHYTRRDLVQMSGHIRVVLEELDLRRRRL